MEPSKTHTLHAPGLVEGLTLRDGQRFCYYVPSNAYIEGEGFRASIVVEGEAGHHPTGTWPYHGNPGEIMPWFWGKTLEEAQEHARLQNAHIGLTDHQADLIVASSMTA